MGQNANRDEDREEPLYSRTTRLAAAGLLLSGWTAILAASTLTLLVSATGIPVFLVFIITCTTVLFRSIPHERRAISILAALISPGIAALAILVLIAPLLDLIGPALEPDIRMPAAQWGGVLVLGALAVMTTLVTGPSQFLWRGASTRRRWIALSFCVALPLAIAITPDPRPDLTRLVLIAIAITLTMVVVTCAELVRQAFETAQGLERSLFSTDVVRTTAYAPREDERRVAVALSGGGYRASLFALGAMLYVHDTCRSAETSPRRVVAVTSVSGGSITNGVIAHGVRIGVDDVEVMDRVARELVNHTVVSGSMFTAYGAWRYYFALLPATCLLLIGTVIVAYGSLSWGITARAIAEPLILVALVRILVLVSSRLPNHEGVVGAFLLAAVGAVGGTMHWFLTDAAWRAALGWVAGASFALLVATVAWTMRGAAIRRNFEGLLRRVTETPLLGQAMPDTHHVFCATEVQTGESAYFASDSIISRAFKLVAARRLSTATAIAASAALPGAFPPVVVRIKGDWTLGVRGRGQDTNFSTGHMILVDGGVRDNLGVSWLDVVQDLHDMVVVSASANRHASRIIRRLLGFTELLALANALNIPYNTRERQRRRAVVDRLFGPGGIGGALVHIEDSPADLARRIRAKATGAEAPGAWLYLSPRPDWEIDQYLLAHRLWPAGAADQAALTARADRVLAHLEELEACLPDPPPLPQQAYLEHKVTTMERPLGGERSWGSDAEVAWWARTSQSISVGTVLNCLPANDAMNLVAHGYYLAMTNLHICAGWPLSTALDTTRLAALFRDTVRPTSDSGVDELVRVFRAVRGRHLRADYPVVHLSSIPGQVRQRGRFAFKRAIVAVGVTSEGALEQLGLWMSPDHEDPSAVERGDPGSASIARKARQTAFWEGALADVRARGLQVIRLCCRELPEAFDGGVMVGSDAALVATAPGMVLLPRFRAYVRRTLAQRTVLSDASHRNLQLREGLLRQSGDGSQNALEEMVRNWGGKFHDFKFESWTEVAALMRLSPELRAGLDKVDAAVEQVLDAATSHVRKRGAASSDETALALISRDLAEAIARSVPIADWRNAHQRLLRETSSAQGET